MSGLYGDHVLVVTDPSLLVGFEHADDCFAGVVFGGPGDPYGAECLFGETTNGDVVGRLGVVVAGPVGEWADRPVVVFSLAGLCCECGSPCLFDSVGDPWRWESEIDEGDGVVCERCLTGF